MLLFGWAPRELRVPLLVADAREFPAVISSHEYAPGDLVEVSTRVLPVRCSTTQSAKSLPKYIGPFSVVEVVNPGAIRLQVPDSYAATHDVFNVSDLRPWFKLADRGLDVEYPEVQGAGMIVKVRASALCNADGSARRPSNPPAVASSRAEIRAYLKQELLQISAELGVQ